MEIPDNVINRPPPIRGRVALIDADILCYRAAFACQRNIFDLYYDHPTLSGLIESFSTKTQVKDYVEDNELEGKITVDHRIELEDEDSLCHTLRSMYDSIMDNTRATKSELYLTTGRTFRHDLAITAPYKAGRTEKPKLLKTAQRFLRNEYGAKDSGTYEADDMLAIRQTELGGKSVICSIDKDLRQVPGLHYNIVKMQVDEVSKEEAWRSLFRQVLVGDTVDNIKGCRGIGPVKANKLIALCANPQEAHNTCRMGFKLEHGDDGEAIYEEMMSLVYLHRKVNDNWKERFGITG